MCEESDRGLVDYTPLTRRRFAALVAATAAAGAGEAAAQAAVTESDVKVRTADGEADAVLAKPEGRGRHPGVLIWPDAGGLRQAKRDMAKRLAGQGYVVLVVNPYYRSGAAPELAKVPRDQRGAWRTAMTSDAIVRDSKAFVAYLDGLQETSDAKVGVQGYCMGGALSFRTAAAVPNRIGAVGSFHGGGLVAANLDSPHRLIGQSRARYLVAVAKNDDARDPQAKAVLKESFATLKRPAIVEVYGGDHGWCVPDNGAYVQAEAERAWAALGDLYRRALV